MSTFEFDDGIGGRLRGTLHAPGATPGDVLTVGATHGTISPAPGGGSQPGAVRVRKIPVAFNSAGLYTGAGFPLFTTAAGEEILDTWLDGSVDWDAGVTPLLDLASAAELGNGEGWWIANGQTAPISLLILSGFRTSYTDSYLAGVETLRDFQDAGPAGGSGVLPRTYPAATEIVAVSWDDDSTSESAPAPYGATAGALTLYVVSSVPA